MFYSLLTADVSAQTEEVVDSAVQQMYQNGGAIPTFAIVLVLIALIGVLVILLSIISSRKKAQVKPISQNEKSKKIAKDANKKKDFKSVKEKQFITKPSGLPKDNVVGAKAKKADAAEMKESVADSQDDTSDSESLTDNHEEMNVSLDTSTTVNETATVDTTEASAQESFIPDDAVIEDDLDYDTDRDLEPEGVSENNGECTEDVASFDAFKGTVMPKPAVLVNDAEVGSDFSCSTGDSIELVFPYNVTSMCDLDVTVNFINESECTEYTAFIEDGFIHVLFKAESSFNVGTIKAKSFLKLHDAVGGKIPLALVIEL